jgi:catechol 2,3-dioxygenase-like lactoylglutathione lyase family enzyme
MLKNGSIIFLPCTDINETVHFLHDIIGLEITQKQSDSLYIFDTGYGYWGFSQYADLRPPLSGQQGVCLSLNYDNKDQVDRQYERLKNQCRIFKEPARHPDFPVYSFFVLGPDDYLIEFQTVNV